MDSRGEPDEWGAELFEVNGAPAEQSAAERAAELKGRSWSQADAAELYDDDTQAFIFLLSIAVQRLGGVMAVSLQERKGEFRLAIDQSELKPGGTGVIRLYTQPLEDA